MFPLQSGDELVFQPPSVIKQDQIFQDLSFDHTLTDDTNNHSTIRGQRGKMRSFEDSDIGKLMHREIERQRRQEMANLYDSLKSRIPPEYLKGKKSISDHMLATVSYIRDTQKNIKKLSARRDELRKLYDSSNLSAEDGSSTGSSPSLVTVNPCKDGVEILISSCISEESFPLSRVFVELVERGLNVVNYVSTKANGRTHHVIHCEANGVGCNDVSELTERLMDVINFRRNYSVKSG